MTDFNFTIIGSGAGGSSAAYELLQNGYSVEVLEEGIKYENQKKNTLEGIAALWRNNGINLFQGDPILNFGEGKSVGGSTVINGGVIAQTHEKILQEWDNFLGENFFSSEDFYNECKKIENKLVYKENINQETLSNSSRILINAAKKKKL